MVKDIDKNIIPCLMTGLVVSSSIFPHICPVPPESRYPSWMTADAPYCEALAERHHDEPSSSRTGGMMPVDGVGTVASGTMNSFATSTIGLGTLLKVL